MKARIFSTLVLWFAVGLALYYGKIWGGLALLLLITAAAHWELCTLLQRCGARPRREVSVALGVVTLAGLCWSVLDPARPALSPAAAIDLPVVLPGLIMGVVTFSLLRAPDKLAAFFSRTPTALSWLYIPCGMAPLAYLTAEFWRHGNDPSGLLLGLWFIATVKFADCGALVFGLTFGKHKLAPSISPGKSWEGCVGGVVTAMGVGAGVAWLLAHHTADLGWTITGLTPGKAALLALPLAVLGIPSDLVESVFKRRAGVKDSGRTIPGIGGAFDLLDSLILTAPVAYVLFKVCVL